ncbi:MAG: sigma-70 family RNA polymerase sigma factor [Planctomycetes bacterium]|nr:sigma-70 family RNA polymerase sigma factor [Planctomycetota bacterium]
MSDLPQSDTQHEDVPFMELLTLHQTQIYGYIRALVHDAEDAKDIFQSTSIILWRKFDQFQAGSSFNRWACSVAQFEVRNFLRSKRSSRVTFSDVLVESLAASAPEENTAVAEARQAALKICLTKLTRPDRELIETFYRGNQRAAEIAHDTGRTRQSIGNSLRRIRRALFECIRRQLATEGL